MVSRAAIDDRSQAGEHGHADAGAPNSGGTGTADTASGGRSAQGTAIADDRSAGHRADGSANADNGLAHKP